ncbi:Competence protein ComM [subsurface metagenome]
MFYRLKSATVMGVDSSIIEIEVDLKKGLPQQTIVGLPDTAVKEAKERVNSAIRNSGFNFPLGKLTINLAPADIKKEGSIFDLGIALGILTVSEQIEIIQDIETFIILGELSLDGFVRPIHGVLAILEDAKEIGIQNLILPIDNYQEARLISGLAIYPVGYLKDAVQIVSGHSSKGNPDLISKSRNAKNININKKKNNKYNRFDVDFSEVKGQNYAVRAVEITASGGHNILLIGSPGSGKTMIASRIPTIIPELSEKESIETTKIYSIAGFLPSNEGLIKNRPFRAPHHTASEISIIGGGKNPIPGEITLAHNGILFLDEFTEFKSNIIQSLRQPIEDGVITIARADVRILFPALFMLVASMNPCPCGYLFDTERKCQCNHSQISKYYMKISGPVLDRIDIQVEVKPLKACDIIEYKSAESSSVIKKRVLQARKIQKERLAKYGIALNALMNVELIKKYCALDKQLQELMYFAVERYKLSARAYYKILKVARTIADLENRDKILKEDILEALSYREVENILYNKPSNKVQVAAT